MLTQQTVLALFDYDPLTGDLIWRVRPRTHFRTDRSCSTFNSLRVGKIAGNIDCLDGYRKIGIDGRLYRAHRLIWMYVNGSWPDGEIDHINHVKADNRIENLRAVSRTENARNIPLRKDNTSGYAGIRQRGGSWGAYISDRPLGTFPTIDMALDARREAERLVGYHQNNGAG